MTITARIYEFLYHDLTLRSVGIFIGVALLVSHIYAFLKYEKIKPWLVALPRNTNFGIGVLLVCFVWAFIVWSEMDLGEFFNLERPVQLILIIGFFAVSAYVKEFLAVRAIGFFFILAAAPVLDAAFLRPPSSRLLLVALAYVWILEGMFWVGMPYVMRDQIGWATANAKRWKMLTLAGAIYGALVLGCALAFY